MNLLLLAVVLALVAAAVDYFIGIKEPWRKIVLAGVVVIFVVGLILLVVPGIFPIVR